MLIFFILLPACPRSAEHEPTTCSAPHSFSAPNLRPSREVYAHEEAYRPENYSTPSAEYVDTSKDYEIALRMSEGWERLTPLTRSGAWQHGDAHRVLWTELLNPTQTRGADNERVGVLNYQC